MKLTCRSCGKSEFETIINFGTQPWCNDFLPEDKIRKESYYPLKLVYCKNCELLQLTHTVPKETMFIDHTYVSGTTKTLVEHFYNLAKENIEQFKLNKYDLIVDIGGNDGSQLMQYKKLGIDNVRNVESAKNICQISRRNSIPTVNDFFTEELAANWIIYEKKQACLINASGVFFHLEDLHSVIKGVKNLLASDGVFIIQFMYAGQMIDNNSFDMIYHEHLCYYTLKSLQNLLAPYDLNIFDAYHSDIHSGSIIAKVCHDNVYEKTERFYETWKKDEDYTLEKFNIMAGDAKYHSETLKDLLTDLYKQGKTIYAFGAPAKGNTLLNYMGIDYKVIQKAVEKNKLKVGLYLPQSYIPIVEESKNDLPDYYLLLSHNFQTEILNNYKEEINSGKVKFIIPFPKLKIISEYA